jgi:double-stranded uracil-DNA glycosylase
VLAFLPRGLHRGNAGGGRTDLGWARDRTDRACGRRFDHCWLRSRKQDGALAGNVTMTILPDLLSPGLDLIIVGTAAGRTSAARRAYYASRGNRFWRTLHEAGLTPLELQPGDYARLTQYHIGLTDLAKHTYGMDRELTSDCFDPARLRQAIETASPIILAFNGKKAACVFFGVQSSKLAYGRQAERIGRTMIYVCPQTSAANGHWSPHPWYDLAHDLRSSRKRLDRKL